MDDDSDLLYRGVVKNGRSKWVSVCERGALGLRRKQNTVHKNKYFILAYRKGDEA